MKSLLIATLLLIAVPAAADCYKCVIVDPADLACATTKSGGYTNCVSWANAREKGCEADGDYCVTQNVAEPEQPMVRNRCAAPRYVLTSVELPRTRQPRLVLALVEK